MSERGQEHCYVGYTENQCAIVVGLYGREFSFTRKMAFDGLALYDFLDNFC